MHQVQGALLPAAVVALHLLWQGQDVGCLFAVASLLPEVVATEAVHYALNFRHVHGVLRSLG